jgi:hypothetical protein
LAPMLLPKSPKPYGSDHPVVPSNVKESTKQVADLQVISIGICLTPMLSDGRRLICSLWWYSDFCVKIGGWGSGFCDLELSSHHFVETSTRTGDWN